jgi:hypothetical protein
LLLVAVVVAVHSEPLPVVVAEQEDFEQDP